MMTERYNSEYRPEWKLIADTPPPVSTKILLKARNGGAVIGQYYPEGGFVAWCGLPKFTTEQKHRLEMMHDHSVSSR